MNSLTIARPDDWHVHLREGAALRDAVRHTARTFARAIVMPNLKPPVTTVAAARDYRRKILEVAPSGFEPLMTLYLTDLTSEAEIRAAAESGFVKAVKYYPAGATTNSDSGVTALEKAFPALEAMQKHDVPLLVHGESTAPGVDVFDRERVFVESSLATIVRKFPGLRVVLEHATTGDAVAFVMEAGAKVAATLTAHHLLYSRNSIFEGGIRPHYYCLPILKREEHRRALVAAATGGSPKFFLGTDSAPHPRHLKEHPCGCAGIFTAHAAIELYAEVFEFAGALERLEGFASFNGADFYRLPRNEERLTLVRESWTPPADYPFGESTVVPLRAGEKISWRVS
jgi:dihydroorotase